MSRRTYSAAEREHALALITEYGIAHAHRETSIPKPTLSRWAHDENIDTEHSAREQTRAAVEASKQAREVKREQFRVLLLDKAVDMLERMDQPHIDFRGKDAQQVEFPKPAPEGCKSYATAAAILIDKLRLELGEATARTEIGATDPKVAAVHRADELAARRTKKQAA